MTQVTRLFDFPYYQQDKYTSIPDALNTKQDGVWIKIHTRIYIQAMQSQEHYCEWELKNDKIAVISSATERNGILWILVFYKLEPKTYPYTHNHRR
jgi:long-chain acyl-CoA synthetase